MRLAIDEVALRAIQRTEDVAFSWLVSHAQLPDRAHAQQLAHLQWMYDTNQINEFGCEDRGA